MDQQRSINVLKEAYRVWSNRPHLSWQLWVCTCLPGAVCNMQHAVAPNPSTSHLAVLGLNQTLSCLHEAVLLQQSHTPQSAAMLSRCQIQSPAGQTPHAQLVNAA
eukprot:GHUV01029084.1.p1 GENE.GHUV01029084.1~~GHUV01029084.1.p1  ORF type:complete len:105 (-),score=19.37 GHUV01029084.1:436-750(-)